MLLLLLGIAAIVYLLTKRETYDIDEGVPNLSDWTEEKHTFNRDEIESAVMLCSEFFKKKSGTCVYIVETNQSKKYIKEKETPVYEYRFMMTTTNTNFPYGIGCTFYIKDNKVLGARTQQVGMSTFEPYESEYGKFITHDDIVSNQDKTILRNN